jgi:hypothetical protein
MNRNGSQAVLRSKWFMPVFCLGLGLVVLVASWSGGQPGAGVFALVIMAVFGLCVMLATSRSETVRGLTTGRDERFAQIDLKATAVAGLTVLLTVIVAWLVQLAGGQSGAPYDWIAAIGGLAYALAVVFFRWRG